MKIFIKIFSVLEGYNQNSQNFSKFPRNCKRKNLTFSKGSMATNQVRGLKCFKTISKLPKEKLFIKIYLKYWMITNQIKKKFILNFGNHRCYLHFFYLSFISCIYYISVRLLLFLNIFQIPEQYIYIPFSILVNHFHYFLMISSLKPNSGFP